MPPVVWAVVANVKHVTRHGPDASEEHTGLKHFPPGAKVWLLPPQWGDGWASTFAVGHHRGSRRLVRLIVRLEHLTDFRVAAVHSPAVAKTLTWPLQTPHGDWIEVDTWGSREDAQATIERHPLTRTRLKVLNAGEQ